MTFIFSSNLILYSFKVTFKLIILHLLTQLGLSTWIYSDILQFRYHATKYYFKERNFRK